MARLLPVLILFTAICFLSFDTAPTPKAPDAKRSKTTTDTIRAVVKLDTIKNTEGGLIFSLDSNRFNFGEIPNYEWITVIFYAKNVSDHPISIYRSYTTCGCDISTVPREPIIPGEQVELRYTYDSHRIGPNTKTMTVAYENQTRFFKMTCNVTAYFTHDEFCYNHLPTCVWVKPFGEEASAMVAEKN